MRCVGVRGALGRCGGLALNTSHLAIFTSRLRPSYVHSPPLFPMRCVGVRGALGRRGGLIRYHRTRNEKSASQKAQMEELCYSRARNGRDSCGRARHNTEREIEYRDGHGLGNILGASSLTTSARPMSPVGFLGRKSHERVVLRAPLYKGRPSLEGPKETPHVVYWH